MFVVEDNLFQLGTQYGFGGVFVRIQGVNEREVFAFRKHEGAEAIYAAKGFVSAPRHNPSRVIWVTTVQCDRQTSGP